MLPRQKLFLIVIRCGGLVATFLCPPVVIFVVLPSDRSLLLDSYPQSVRGFWGCTRHLPTSNSIVSQLTNVNQLITMLMSMRKMPVMNKLRSVLEGKGIQNPNQLRTATGIGQQTALDAWNDPFWVPSAPTLQTICRVFKIQPGDFLFYLDDDDNESKSEA